MTKSILIPLACLALGCSSSSSTGDGGGAAADGAGSSSSGSSSGALDDSGSSSSGSGGSSGGGDAGGSSSGSSGGSSSGYGLLNCPSSPAFEATCGACIGSMCSGAVSAVNSACSTYFPCVCPVGADAGGCVASTGCFAAVGMIPTQCQACSAVCNPQADAGSD